MKEPKLEKPGAGLPWLESWIAQVGFFIFRSLTSKEKALRFFEKEAELIINVVTKLDAPKRMQRVLIDRISGIEDSSRYWSVNMALQHLNSVNNAIIEGVETLASGSNFGLEVKIANFKPKIEAAACELELFRKANAEYAKKLNALPSLGSKVTHPHPWFGPLDAHGWHCLAAVHNQIHRLQIEKIIAGLDVQTEQ